MHFGMCKLVMFSGNRCWHLYTQVLCLSSYITWGNIVIFWPSLVRGVYLATSWRQLGAERFIYKRAAADSSAPVLSWLPWRQHPSDARSPEALTPPYTIPIPKPWRPIHHHHTEAWRPYPEFHLIKSWLSQHHSHFARYASQPLGQLTSPVSWGNSPHETSAVVYVLHKCSVGLPWVWVIGFIRC